MTDRLRVLIVNPFGIGDVLFSTPLIRAFRRAFPSSYLAYLGNRRTEGILRRNPHLDEVFIYEKDEAVMLWARDRWSAIRHVLGLLKAIRRRRFDLALDLSLGERYSFFLAWLGVARRIGLDFRHRGRFLTHRFPIEGYEEQHVVEYYAQLLEMIGLRMLEPTLELVPREEDRRFAAARVRQLVRRPNQPLIGMVPAGGISWGLQAHFRRWPKEGFIDVGRALGQRHGATILVFGEPKDMAICEDISRAICPCAVNMSGQTTLEQFVSLLGQCVLVVTNDGGPVHIATSQAIPTVSIFGPVDPYVYGPYPLTSSHRVVYQAELPCRPCYHRFKLPPCPYERECLTQVEPGDVIEACEALLPRPN